MQVMSLIAYLMEKKQNYGPPLIIVPNAGGRALLRGCCCCCMAQLRLGLGLWHQLNTPHLGLWA